MKRERGCEAKPVIPQELDGEELNRCIRRPFLDHPRLISECIEVYAWYNKGFLPDTGTYLDQAAAFVELVRFIDKTIEEAKAERDKIEASKGKPNLPKVVK